MKNTNKIMFTIVGLVSLFLFFSVPTGFAAEKKNTLPEFDKPLTREQIVQPAFANEECTLSFKAHDKEKDPITYTLISIDPNSRRERQLLSGAMIDASGIFRWTPNADDAGKRFWYIASISDGSTGAIGEPAGRSQMFYIDVTNRNPKVIDYSEFLPPVGNQGAIPSSASWALGYYLKTFQERMEHGAGWDVTKPEYQFNPYFIYNQISGDVWVYSSPLAYASYTLEHQGCATRAAMPGTQMPTIEQYEAAMPYRTDYDSEFRADWYIGTNMLNKIKNNLDAQKLVVITIPVVPSLRAYKAGVFNGTGVVNDYQSLAIVGYNDNLAYKDEGRVHTGAFKVVNSWGTGWGERGYGWLSYSYVLNRMVELVSALDRINYQPMAIVSYSIGPYKQNTRKKDDTLFVQSDLMGGQGLNYLGIAPIGGDTLTGKYPTSFARDITDYLEFLPPSPEKKWVLSVLDQAPIANERLDSFKIKYRTKVDQPFQEYNATNLPINISSPNDGVTAYISGQHTSNQLPTAPTVVISPAQPTNKDTLVATITVPSTDVDGDQITYSYKWYIKQKVGAKIYWNYYGNGAQLSGCFHADDTIKCVVIPHDGKADGLGGVAQVAIQKTPPKWKKINDQHTFEGSNFGFYAETQDYAPTYVYSVSGSPKLPKGIKIHNSGPRGCLFTWIPDHVQAGTYPITFTVKDGALSDSQTINITVSNVPVLKPIPNMAVKAGKLLQFTLSTKEPGKDKPIFDAFDHYHRGLPEGATLNHKTGVFTWTPNASQIGKYVIDYRVYEEGGDYSFCGAGSNTITVQK